jgi:hypothetical protein
MALVEGLEEVIGVLLTPIGVRGKRGVRGAFVPRVPALERLIVCTLV